MKQQRELNRVGECLYKHSNGTYYAIVKKGGRQIKKSLRTRDKVVAKNELKDFRLRIERTFGSEGRLMQFTELADAWLASRRSFMQPSTFETTSGIVKNLKARFGHLIACEIKPRHIADWSISRQAEKTRLGRPLSARRYNYEVQTLKLVFRYGSSPLRIIHDDPTLELTRRPLGKFTKLTPTAEQFRALVAEMRREPNSAGHGYAADLVELLAYSGIRIGGARYLTWQKVDFGAGSITFRNEKFKGGGRNYTVPLNPALRALLSRMRDAVPEALLTDRIIKIDDAKKSLAGACRRAKLPAFSHHSLRHFFASNAVSTMVDFRTVAEWLDHADGGFLVASTYAHVRAEHSQRMSNLMTFSA